MQDLDVDPKTGCLYYTPAWIQCATQRKNQQFNNHWEPKCKTVQRELRKLVLVAPGESLEILILNESIINEPTTAQRGSLLGV